MLNFLWLLISGYLTLNLALYFYQDNFILYPPAKSNFSESIPESHRVTFRVDSLDLDGIQIRHNSGSWIIYFGGNAEDVFYNYFDFLQKLNSNVIAVNYRGYAGNPGKPSIETMLQDADELVSKVISSNQLKPNQIILIGRSLGSAIAIALSEKYKVAGIVAVTPFDTLADLGRRHYPYFPISVLLKNNLNNLQIASESLTPLLVINGESDYIIPSEHSTKLFNTWKGENKTLVSIEYAGHNDIHAFPEYYPAINKFIGALAD